LTDRPELGEHRVALALKLGDLMQHTLGVRRRRAPPGLRVARRDGGLEHLEPDVAWAERRPTKENRPRRPSSRSC
jgi:hypothetical protein